MSKMQDRAERKEQKAEQKAALTRQIAPIPDDPALAAWLCDLFRLNVRAASEDRPGIAPTESGPPESFPESVTVRSCSGPDGAKLGPHVCAPNEWKPKASSPPSTEDLVVISSKIVAACKHDATVLGRMRRYSVQAHSALKGSVAYARFLLMSTPGPAEYTEHEAVAGEGDEEITAGRVTESLLAEVTRDRRWMMNTIMAALSGTIERQDYQLEAMQKLVSDSFEQRIKTAAIYESMLSKEHERKLAAEEQAFKQEQWKQLIAPVLPLLPAFTAKIAAAVSDKFAPPSPSAASDGVVSPPVPPPVAPPGGHQSPGRDALNAFVQTLSDEQGDALFGPDDDETKGGILDKEQIMIIRAAAQGAYPFDACMAALRESSNKIRMDQFNAVTKLLDIAQLAALIALVSSKGDAAPPAAAAPETAPKSDVAAVS